MSKSTAYPPVAISADEHLFTSEAVTPGHPDKVADGISDRIVDAAIGQDPNSRVAIETMVNTNFVGLAGEIRTEAKIDYEEVVRNALRELGYDGFDPLFGADSVEVMIRIDQQSGDIAQGVDSDDVEKAGAGDQGMMFGYATRETRQRMPEPIWLAHRLADRLTAVREDGTIPYLRPDGKTQVTMRIVNGVPVEIVGVLISIHHKRGVDQGQIRKDLIEHVLDVVLPAEKYDRAKLHEAFLVNPTGVFEIGGPVADAGLTGRKIVVDSYGGSARHGGGAFSGKDPSKVDRSGAYAMRWVAKNVVEADLASRCEIQVAYAIGVAHPVSLMVETFGTEKIERQRIVELIDEHFDLRPLAYRRELDLHRPIYAKTSAGGHFGREDPDFTWERTDKAEALRRAALTEATAAAIGQAE